MSKIESARVLLLLVFPLLSHIFHVFHEGGNQFL